MPALNPFQFTVDRRLRSDKNQRAAQYFRFDHHALCQEVLRLYSSAKYIASFNKEEGGSNRAFIITHDNRKRIVARLPSRTAGPPELTTNFEVATYRYRGYTAPSLRIELYLMLLSTKVHANTNVPFPKLLDWSDDPSNPFDNEYILKEHAKVVKSYKQWRTTDIKQKIRCIWAIAMLTNWAWSFCTSDSRVLY